MGAVTSVTNAVVDVVEDVGATLDDIVIQPAISIVEGSINSTANALNTAAKTTEALVKGDIQGSYDELSQGLAGAEDVISDTYMEIRDPLQASAVIVGNYLLPGSSLLTSQLVSDEAQAMLNTNGGRTLNFAAGATGGYQGNTANYGFNSTDPNAVGGVTGPDNIDVGGGFNPADGAGGVGGVTGPDNIDVGGGYNPSGEVTSQQITSDIANAAADNIDAGGGWSPATGATQAEFASAKAAMASKGITFKQALDGVRAGLFVNSLLGDPLGLSGEQGGNASPTGSTGFEMLPIPSTWQSPKYAEPSAPIDLNSIFTDQNLLGGTQWQGLPQQQNVSFNDIFASGQQQTPMGNMVDINQIVSAILGQNTVSPKST